MAQTNFSGPVDSSAGFEYNGTGVTLVTGTSTVSSTAVTVSSGLTTVNAAWAQIFNFGNADATSPKVMEVDSSGSAVTLRARMDTGAIASTVASVRWFAWGDV